MRRALARWSFACAALLLSACGGTPPDRTVPATPALIATSDILPQIASAGQVVVQHSPTTTLLAAATATLPPQATAIIIHGKLYDAARGIDQRLTNAVIEWQFTALDWQAYNGRLVVPDGIFQLPLIVRPDDELIITAQAPGYQPSTAQVQATQLGEFGTRLNFGLIRANGPVPTLPGGLGPIKVSGIVYNVTRGLAAPIEQATITILRTSIVRPPARIDLSSTATGTFSTTLELHTTDQVELIISASGYLTTTLTQSGKDLAKTPRLDIGLRPAPR
jgi:hypothetical protein